MQTTTHLTSKEKREYFGYLLLLFVFISAALGCLLFYGVSNPFKTISEADKQVLEQGKIFEDKQKMALPLYDSIFNKINAIKTSRNNVLEADINEEIRKMNSYYVGGNTEADPRSISFRSMGTFLQMYLEDAVKLHTSIGNNQMYEKQLGDCKMGLGRTEDQIRALNPTGR